MKTTSRLAMAAGASLLATNVLAADLGGNCCADLEERVAELEATTARKGNRKVSLTVFGQVNKAILWHDSDQDDAYRSERFTIVDNDASMSRFGFRGSAKIRPDLEAGYVMVIGVQENLGTSTNPLSFTDTNQTKVNGLLIRENYLYINSTQWGQVSLGQASQATDGLYEINLATAQVTPGGMDSAEQFLGQLYATTFLGPWDGARRQGIYYRSPTLHGFILSAGWGHKTHDGYTSSTTDCSVAVNCDADDFWEVALRYTAEFNGVRFAAGIGYRDEDNRDGNDNQIWLGSASVMHTPTGLFLSGGYGNRDSDTVSREQQGWWLMAGVDRKFFEPGNTVIYAEYGETDFDVNATTRRDGNYWGFGVVQKIDAAAMDLYINVRRYELDSYRECDYYYCYSYNGDDATVVVSGAIIRF